MAKLYGNFKDVNNNDVIVYIINDKIPYDIEIGADDTSLTQFCWDSPVVITDEANDTRQHIRPKSCTINLLTKKYLGEWLYSSKDIDTSVSIYVNNECRFAGFCTPNTYSQPYAKIWERLTLNAIDYLSILEYVRPTDNDTYEDLKRDADVYSMKKYLQDFVFNNVDLLNRDNKGLSHVYYDMSKTTSADGSSTQVSNVTQWTSSDTSVATVDSGGHVYAVGPGTCTITGTCMYDTTQSIIYDVTVTWPMNYIVIKNVPEPTQNTAGIGDVLTVVEYDRVPVTNEELYPDIVWDSTTITSSNENVLSVEMTGPDDARRGIVYIQGYGEATITVNDNYTYKRNGQTVTETLQSDSFTCTITNDVTVLNITGISVTQEDPNRYDIIYNCGDIPYEDVAVTFFLEDETVARIVNNQLVVHASGTVTIHGYVNSNHDVRAEKPVSVEYNNYGGGHIMGSTEAPYTITIADTDYRITPGTGSFDITVTDYGTSFASLFSECKRLKQINSITGSLDNIVSTSRMFYNCNNMDYCDIAPLLIGVIDASYMFYKCNSLPNIILSFSLSNQVNIAYMFNGCTALTEIQVDGLTLSDDDITHTFDGCDSLERIEVSGMSQVDINRIVATLNSRLDDREWAASGSVIEGTPREI